MATPNPLLSFVKRVNRYPCWLRAKLLTWVFTHKVKLTGTVGIEILHTDITSVTFRQKNKKKVQNHIGGVHAAAMALLAESATGFLVGLNLPGDKLPLIKTMKVDFVKRAQGALTATAWISAQQQQQLQQQAKGEFVVAVKVTDEHGNTPIECEMLWAWVEKRK